MLPPGEPISAKQSIVVLPFFIMLFNCVCQVEGFKLLGQCSIPTKVRVTRI